MTNNLIRNNLRKKETVVIESKQRLQTFVLPLPPPPPFHFPAFNDIFFLTQVSVNYNIRYQNVFVMHKLYVLGLCDHIQLK